MSMLTVISIVCLCIFLASPFVLYMCLDVQAKRLVHIAPKIPMYICDTHGAFPAKSLLKITVPNTAPGTADLVVDMCPICFDMRMKESEALLSAKKK